MSQAEIAKALVRPPFANYDLVVYFGCGLFALPLLQHYALLPFGLELPNLESSASASFAQAALSTLTILMIVYVIGHAVAYLGSQLIEKTADICFGKTSTIVLISSQAQPQSRNKRIREQIIRQFSSLISKRAIVSSLVRVGFHLPMLPFYILFWILGVFGFYGSRVPRYVVIQAGRNLKSIVPGAKITLRSRWFKPMEGVILNHNPSATARMYNYLIISGLFRSLSFMLLACAWLEYYRILHHSITGHMPWDGWISAGRINPDFSALTVVIIFYFVSLFSYLKFQRRYVEEAIFAMAVSKP